MADLGKFKGKKVKVTIDHGGTPRVLVGKLRTFETEARYDPETGKQTIAPETRWELTGVSEDRSEHRNQRGERAYPKELVRKTHEAVGIDPGSVTDISLT